LFQVAFNQLHLTMDSEDPSTTMEYLMLGTSLSFLRYLTEITFEYLEYMDVYRVVHKIRFYIYLFSYSSSVPTVC
jgi:hypothetical protein